MKFPAERRGTVAAAVVAILIGVLYVLLQPSDNPQAAAPAPKPTTTLPASTTTTDPVRELCDLADQYATAAADQDVTSVARLAEHFFDRARQVTDGEIRAEYDAAYRYYAEYNAIGEPYDYDLFQIAAAGNGERWLQLLLRQPLGVDVATANVAFLCGVELPPPPTITTTTTRPAPRPTTTDAPSAPSPSTAAGRAPQTGTPTQAPATTAPH